MATSPQQSPSSPSAGAGKAMLFMALLTIQFGLQPILTRTFTPKTVCKSSVILVQESLKFVLAMSMLGSSGQLKVAIKGWSISSWIQVAALPALLYTIQNTCALMAYQNLDGVTFNVLNQTKTLSAAVCCYLLMGRKQSKFQILALGLLFISALIVEDLIPLKYLLGGNGVDDNKEEKIVEQKSQSPTHFTHGVLPVLMASLISGLAGAISQKNLQNGGRNPYLFSSELCVASVISLSTSLLFSADGKRIQSHGFFDQWTVYTLIPVFTNAVGGIVVGLVTKYAGSVRKGFALIFGMVLTGVAQSIHDGVALSISQIIGGIIAALSLWLHATNPYVKDTGKAGKRQKQD